MRRGHPLQRSQRNVDLRLREQPFHDDTISNCWPIEQRARCRLVCSIERPRGGPRLRFRCLTLAQVAANAITRNAQLAGDPLLAPLERSERSEAASRSRAPTSEPRTSSCAVTLIRASIPPRGGGTLSGARGSFYVAPALMERLDGDKRSRAQALKPGDLSRSDS